MSDQKKEHNPVSEPEQEQTTVTPEEEAHSAPEEEATQNAPEPAVETDDKYLRLAAEYDNYRKRTAKEKESLWTEAKAQTAAAFLPVYDNLERALKQETCDTAYAKGVEMTMNQLKDVLTKLGIEEIPAQGEKFDPNFHNAVMHVDDDSVEENTIVGVFQAGFKTGEKVIRFSMVKVAN